MFKLVDIVSKGGNYLLNVGPTSAGVIPQPSQDNLRAVGEWLKLNGEAVYGTDRSPFGEEFGDYAANAKGAATGNKFAIASDGPCRLEITVADAHIGVGAGETQGALDDPEAIHGIRGLGEAAAGSKILHLIGSISVDTQEVRLQRENHIRTIEARPRQRGFAVESTCCEKRRLRRRRLPRSVSHRGQGLFEIFNQRSLGRRDYGPGQQKHRFAAISSLRQSLPDFSQCFVPIRYRAAARRLSQAVGIVKPTHIRDGPQAGLTLG